MFPFSERLTAPQTRLLCSKEKSNPVHESSNAYLRMDTWQTLQRLYDYSRFSRFGACCYLGFNMRPEFESVNDSSLYKGRDAIWVHCC